MSRLIKMCVYFSVMGSSAFGADTHVATHAAMTAMVEQCKSDFIHLIWTGPEGVVFHSTRSQSDRLFAMDVALKANDFRMVRALVVEFTFAQVIASNEREAFSLKLLRLVLDRMTTIITAYFDEEQDTGLKAQALAAFWRTLNHFWHLPGTQPCIKEIYRHVAPLYQLVSAQGYGDSPYPL